MKYLIGTFDGKSKSYNAKWGLLDELWIVAITEPALTKHISVQGLDLWDNENKGNEDLELFNWNKNDTFYLISK